MSRSSLISLKVFPSLNLYLYTKYSTPSNCSNFFSNSINLSSNLLYLTYSATSAYLLGVPSVFYKYISLIFDLPVIMKALNIANNIEIIKSTFSKTNKLNIISELQIKHLYQVLKCSALPKKPLLIINVSIINIINLKSIFSDTPIKSINIVSATLKINDGSNLLILSIALTILLHLD